MTHRPRPAGDVCRDSFFMGPKLPRRTGVLCTLLVATGQKPRETARICDLFHWYTICDRPVRRLAGDVVTTVAVPDPGPGVNPGEAYLWKQQHLIF